jgi:ABC-2 type transport system ATP-binding protein
MARAHVDDRRRSVIGTLSKGYRQRVGLADALVASPPVLILDEPTAGLDPVQVREVRELLTELAGDHTVLLSSHQLREVEAVAARVVVLVGGKVVAEGAPADIAGDSSLEDVFLELAR